MILVNEVWALLNLISDVAKSVRRVLHVKLERVHIEIILNRPAGQVIGMHFKVSHCKTARRIIYWAARTLFQSAQ